MKITVTSKNPVKVGAAKKAFERVFPKTDLEIESFSVPSDVSDQPMDESETLAGAMNRCNNAGKKVNSDFIVGIEGGIEKIDDEYHCFAWIYIKGKDRAGKAKTSTFILPEEFNQYLDKGMELGHASDIIWGKKNTKHGIATIGHLTNSLITRESYYVQALILALIPFFDKKSIDI